MEPILTLKNMSKHYSNGRGVKNISFELAPGEVLGLLGPNGSGKTTIMKAITGLLRPDEGEIRLFGYDALEDRPHALAKVGTLIEQPALYENLTALDNLRLAARWYPGVDRARIDQMLELVGLAGRAKDKCGRYSLGMKQRLGLALALLHRPELVVLDEPTNGLDIEAVVEIREIIIRMAAEYGTTFLIASHLADEIERMCGRVLVLYDGEAVCMETKEEALRLHPSMEDFFLATVREHKGPVVL